jgi:hypothetical protein
MRRTNYPLQYSCTNNGKCNIVDKTTKPGNKKEYITNSLVRICLTENKLHYIDSKEYIRTLNIKNLCKK